MTYLEHNNKLFYKRHNITTPFGKRRMLYADFIGSCQPCPLIEQTMISKIYPYYANTHSNAHNGILMKNKMETARTVIKTMCSVDDSYKLLFCGNGATGCFNHLVNIIDYHLYDKVVIFVSTYEHYSNYLPWLELKKSNCNITIEIIPLVSTTYEIDLEFLQRGINTFVQNIDMTKSNLIICTVTACSNVTGLIMPLQKIRTILDKVVTDVTTLFFADYACSAPYVQIHGQILDGIVFSGHKFHGGISTPGILIAKEHLFNKSIPHDTGGGCVCKCTAKEVVYEKDIEKRESAGTPNIIGIIRLERAVHIKNVLHEIITERELELCKIIKYKINIFSKKYDSFASILSGKAYDPVEHLPIFTFSLTNAHYNFIVVLLNDLFGIQTRGGISCCGLLGEYVEKTIGVKGWCRISLHWSMSDNDAKFIFDSVEYVIQHHTEYTNMYKYNDKENLFYYTLAQS